MITFWNRSEVYMGLSSDSFNKVLEILSSEKIKYTYRTINHIALKNNATGRFGESPQQSILYYIYVHKNDADICKRIIYKEKLK